MRAEVVAAERGQEVRDAARAWRRAGFVDEDTLSRIVTQYPDDRHRFGLGFRALAFIFAGIATLAMVGLSFFLVEFRGSDDEISPLLFWAVILAGLTELQRGPFRRASAGAESATALMSVLLAVVWVYLAVHGWRSWGVIQFLTLSSFICAAAAWRWGDALFFVGASLSGFGLLAQAPHGRLWWIVASLLLIPACLNAARSAGHSPSHRRGVLVAGTVAILALYAAVHIGSLDQGFIEELSEFSSSAGVRSIPLRSLSILATALLPAGLLGLGWHRREPLLLYSGLLLIGVSIATIRLYRAVMPLSLGLILIGTACLALALWLRRWLRSGQMGEREGFTADPLFDNANRTQVIQSVVAMASLTPSAQAPSTEATPPQNAFEGGRSGGAGASGAY